MATARKYKSSKPKKVNKDYQIEITSKIIGTMADADSIKEWVEPWISTGRPKNFATGNPYRGINIIMMWIETQAKGYEHNLWAGFNQIADKAKGQVQYKQKASYVLAHNQRKKITQKEVKVNGKVTVDEKSFTSFYYGYKPVFNISQTDLDVDKYLGLTDHKPIEAVEKFIASIDHKVIFGGDSAYYNTKTDTIYMPEKKRFKTIADFYATYLHELAHWSGSTHRLNRELSLKKDSESYAFEELVAELTCAFISAELGFTDGTNVENESSSINYIASWIKKMNDDYHYIFSACSHAQRALVYLQTGKIESWENI